MKLRVLIVFLAVLLTLRTVTANGQSFNVTGSWTVHMVATPPSRGVVAVATGCTFQGTANANQTGSQLTGDLSVDLTAGSGCPGSMSATMSGQVSGNQVSMGVMMGGGAFGEATFAGTLTPPIARGDGTAGAARASGIPVTLGAVGAAANTMRGTFTVTSGPFSGTSGTWNATQQAPVATVPALGPWGLAALVLLLLGGAFAFLGRRRAAALSPANRRR
jgi:hypothetical protein